MAHLDGLLVFVLKLLQLDMDLSRILLELIDFVLFFRLFAHAILVGGVAAFLLPTTLIVQASDERREYLERRTHIAIDVGMRRVEPDDKQVFYFFVLEEEQFCEGHEGGCFGVLPSEETLLKQPLVYQNLETHSIFD